uniref:Neuralized E3 ubiquitin protein ligase 1 n=1 Tax=Crocodylus porosus TaxID=8502 RepID=A0A7M4FYZ7_CROPO
MGGQITRNTLYDSIGGPFPASSHRCHHKQKHYLPIPQCGALSISPLLFHPHTKGSQIIMDTTQKAVKRQASFCNAITFSNRPIVIYEQVRLKITKKQCCWSGALRLGFTSKDPSRINPDTLPKYACPDLVSQSGFWAKALPEEFANEGNIIAFWVDKKGRVFYRVNDSAAMLFFSGVRTTEPLWALIDVYGLTRGVQLLASEAAPAGVGTGRAWLGRPVLQSLPGIASPGEKSSRFAAFARGRAVNGNGCSRLSRRCETTRRPPATLSSSGLLTRVAPTTGCVPPSSPAVAARPVSLSASPPHPAAGGKTCQLPTDSEIIPPDCLRPRSFTAIRRPSLRRDTEDTRLSVSLCDLNLQEENFHVMATTCPIPQNSLNSQHSHLLPSQLESDLRFHQLRGAHIKILDDQTVARLEHAREERTLVFTSRPLRINETIFVKINKSNASRTGTLSYGVTSCDPGTLRPSDLPYNPESLVDRKEFWAVCRVLVPLQSGDILGFVVNSEGELHLSHNGASAGMQVCVDCSQPLWMFFGLHGAVMQIRVLGLLTAPVTLDLGRHPHPTQGTNSVPGAPALHPTLGQQVVFPSLKNCQPLPLTSVEDVGAEHLSARDPQYVAFYRTGKSRVEEEHDSRRAPPLQVPGEPNKATNPGLRSSTDDPGQKPGVFIKRLLLGWWCTCRILSRGPGCTEPRCPRHAGCGLWMTGGGTGLDVRAETCRRETCMLLPALL